MRVIRARNVNDAWYQAKRLLNANHVVRPSRVGEVWEYPEPVCTVYERPTERVLFDPLRNCNPFFHLFEALWILAGRNDVEWLAQFNPHMREYSDDGKTFHGAYGHRFRFAFDLDGGAEDDYADQLPKIVRMLKKSPDERRAVLGMWNPLWDLERPEIRDIPCNTHCYLKIRNGALTMTVCCRSNDVILGCYGANAVHFSVLQEYLAAMIGVPVGPYYQISDSWHAYTSAWEKYGGFLAPRSGWHYLYRQVETHPLVHNPERWDPELQKWMELSNYENAKYRIYPYTNPFFGHVAGTLLQAWQWYRREDNLQAAIETVGLCAATDWRKAAVEWLQRIASKRAAKTAAAPPVE